MNLCNKNLNVQSVEMQIYTNLKGKVAV